MKVTANGLKIFENGDSKSLPVLFVHGFPFDHNMWHKQIEDLSTQYYCISYDIRGLGESPAGDGQYTMESFVDDLSLIIYELKLNKPVLCGLSMGGYIALRAVEKMEEKFRGLILCDTKPEADTDEAKLKRAGGIKKINEEGLDIFIPDFIGNCFSERFKTNCRDEYQKIVERSSEFDPLGVKGSLLAMAGRTDTTSYLSRIKVQALILCGEKDILTTPSVMKDLSDKIAGSEFYTVPDSGHIIPIENPEFVNKKILAFLGKVRQP
jgi:3-oxoadipate enol-lactonase